MQAANVPSKPHLRTRTLFMVLTYLLLKVEADSVWKCLRVPPIAPFASLLLRRAHAIGISFGLPTGIRTPILGSVDLRS